jgi:iron complex outermembrane receptor protein
MKKKVLAATISAVGSLGMGCSGTVFADTADSNPPEPGAVPAISSAPAASASEDIATVVVTARRREENLEQVPTAITALSAQQLSEQGITSQSDLQTSVPGFTVRQTQGSNSLTFSIRGQTVDAFTGSQTAVVPYFDEVQLNTGGASTFFDLESIQVLKGPQGTLFGRNTTGGAVLYTSAKPKDETSAYAKVRLGNYNLHEVQGAANVPLLDHTLLVRVAGDVTHQDGYQENVYNGQDLGQISRQSGRLSALWRPMEGLENSLVAEMDYVGGNSTATRLRTVNRVNPSTFQCVNPNVVNCASDLLFSPLVDSAYSFPGMWAAYTATHPNLNPNGIAAYLDQDSPKLGFWQANEAAPVYHGEQDYFLANTTSYELMPDAQIKNIFGVSESNTRDLGSSVGAPYPVFYSANLTADEYGNHVKNYTYSDELQLQGKALDKALTYIVGAYYQSEDSNTLFPQVYFDFSPVVPGTSVNSDFEIKDKTPAVYAQSTYDFTSLGATGLSLTTGFRYTWESVDITQLAESPYSPGTHQSTRYSNPGWTLGLSYQATDDLLLYVQRRRSWRSGGFNGTAPPSIDTGSGIIDNTNLYKPEFVNDIEVGSKFAGSVLNRPIRANIALYKQRIDNVQRAEFPDPPGPLTSIAYTVNVPEAKISGVELDATIKPVTWLETGLSGALTYARFVDGKNTADVFGTTYIFGPYADVPRASGSLYATVFLPTPSAWGPMDVRTDLYAQTGMYFSNNNDTITPDTRIPGYGLVNMRYDWREICGSKFSMAAFVKNLTDKEYYTGGFALTASLGVNSVAIGTPQMFGAELSYEF